MQLTEFIYAAKIKCKSIMHSRLYVVHALSSNSLLVEKDHF